MPRSRAKKPAAIASTSAISRSAQGSRPASLRSARTGRAVAASRRIRARCAAQTACAPGSSRPSAGVSRSVASGCPGSVASTRARAAASLGQRNRLIPITSSASSPSPATPASARNCTRVVISASPKASAAQSAASAEPSGQNARVKDSSAIAARLRRITRASGSAPRPARRSSVIRSAFPVPPRSLLEPQGACPIQSGMVSRFSISSKLGRARTTSK